MVSVRKCLLLTYLLVSPSLGKVRVRQCDCLHSEFHATRVDDAGEGVDCRDSVPSLVEGNCRWRRMRSRRELPLGKARSDTCIRDECAGDGDLGRTDDGMSLHMAAI